MIRYVLILQDHFTAVVKLGILHLDIPAMVRNSDQSCIIFIASSGTSIRDICHNLITI